MTPFSQLDPLWARPIAVAVIALGLVLVWRGLRGGRDGGRALLGQRIDMLHRIEGFRLMVFGLVLIGVGGGDLAGAVALDSRPGYWLRRDPGIEHAHRRLEVEPPLRRGSTGINGDDRQA